MRSRRKVKGRAYLEDALITGKKGWAKTGKMAPPLAQSSPPGKEESKSKGGESPREGKSFKKQREPGRR